MGYIKESKVFTEDIIFKIYNIDTLNIVKVIKIIDHI